MCVEQWGDEFGAEKRIFLACEVIIVRASSLVIARVLADSAQGRRPWK